MISVRAGPMPCSIAYGDPHEQVFTTLERGLYNTEMTIGTVHSFNHETCLHVKECETI